MARLVLGLLLLAVAAAADDNNAALLRGSANPADRQVAPNQVRECPPGRCPQITCIKESQMVQKKCTTASAMCPSGFCAAVGNCTSCSRRSLFSEDNDRNAPFFGFQTPLPTEVDGKHRALSTACPDGLCMRFTCAPQGGSVGFCESKWCPANHCPINGECVKCTN